jgi:malonyl-CoA O-methyltransferase
MDEGSRYQLDKRRVRERFDRAAAHYDAAAVLQREVCDRLLERLALIRLQPHCILDAGAGTGYGARGLRARYPRTRLVALDVAPAMLMRVRRHAGWFRQPRLVAGDIESLPFRDGSFDLVFSNLTLQWCNSLDRVLWELRRVLSPGGLLLFTTFGPDTLKELRAAWGEASDDVHVNAFVDMHDIGDAMVRAGFADPVMDAERLTVTYADMHRLLRDLKAVGAANATVGRPRGITGRGV